MSKRRRLQTERWSDFRRRVDYSPTSVYRHVTRGWEYIPIHPFGDEPEDLGRLQIQPEDCWSVDAWWGIDGDATLLQSCVVGPAPFRQVARLAATATEHEERYVYLTAIFDAPFVTRVDFEAAMVRFADLGFPNGPLFQWRKGVRCLPLP